MESSRKTIKNYLLENPNSSELIETMYSMYYDLEELHKKGYYAENINFNTVSFSQSEGTHKRFDFGVLNTSENAQAYNEHCLLNILSLTYTSLGMFAYSYSSELRPSNPLYFDYSKISKQDPDFVLKNYAVISDSIPYGRDYFDNIMSGNYDYFCNYIDKNRAETTRESSRGSYVKTTPFGKGYGDDDNNFAYIKVWFYPIIILCVSLISFVVYVLYQNL